MRKGKEKGSTNLIVIAVIILIIFVLLMLIPIFAGEDPYHMVILMSLDFALILSLIANFIQYRKIVFLKEGPSPAKAAPKKPAPARPAKEPVLRFDPKLLPDPGLVYRFDLSKPGESTRRITIGQAEGTIKTYSTEIVDGHLELDIRVKQDSDQDIYDQSKAIRQRYQLEIRRGGRAMVYYPGSDRFREMEARERILIQEEPDNSGDFQYTDLEPKNPIRFQLGDRLRHDGKFLKGYIEFHIFTREVETEVAGYKRLDKMFFLRIFKIFPGYDTAHPDDDGLYPMIDPFITR